MRELKYLIVGGGMAAHSATQGIRELDATGNVALISAEPDPLTAQDLVGRWLAR